ncbi:MAG: hypothetical protein IPI67_29255 [Myxococcales bacterium]|nr:hypothetical protein [Myxococcales bacterium]
MRGSRVVLLSLPLITVAVIAFALFVVGAPRPYFGARVFGGSTEGATRLALRVSVVERYLAIESPANIGEVTIEAELADGRRVRAVATPDELGMASVALEPPGAVHGPVKLRVLGRSGLLAQGTVQLSQEEWAKGARERGGFLNGQLSGTLVIRAAPGRGAFAVPFTDPLWVEVSGPSGARSGVRLVLEADGADVVRLPDPTDAQGRSVVNLTPRDHIVSLTIKATEPGGEAGEWSGQIPVAVGALRASLEGRKLRIESAIERDVAYFAIVSEQQRLLGGLLPMAADQRGGSIAVTELPELPSGPLWAVVSGEPELDSASTVGWPVRAPQGPLAAEPPRARAVPDRLLVDGMGLGFAADVARRSKARFVALGFTLLAAALAALLLVLEGRRSARVLDLHLEEAGIGDGERRSFQSSRWLGVVVALVCVSMGFAVALLVAMYRIG